MILQFEGRKGNWSYVESEVITWSRVDVSNVVKDYKKQGSTDSEHELFMISKLRKSIYDEISNVVGAIYENTCEIGDKSIYDWNSLIVVSLGEKNSTTYVFNDNIGIYLLNNAGKTVQRLN